MHTVYYDRTGGEQYMAIWGVKFQTADSKDELIMYMEKFYTQSEIESSVIMPYRATNGRTKYVLLDSDSKRLNQPLF